jgi:hypothetical protein
VTADSDTERLALLADLDSAIDAIDEAMASDKGLRGDEWTEWCNKHLPLVKKYGRQPYTVSFL